MDYNNLVSNVINANSLIKINENIYLTNYQKEILDRYHIEYETCNDIKDILFLIDDILETDYEEELDDVAKNLQEFSYYNFTNK